MRWHVRELLCGVDPGGEHREGECADQMDPDVARLVVQVEQRQECSPCVETNLYMMAAHVVSCHVSSQQHT